MKDGEYWRASFTDRDQNGIALLRSYMEAAGLEVSFDAVGNLYGTLRGRTDEVIMAGSHRDTVREGGKYDGILGVLSAIEAVRSLKEECGQPEKTVTVTAFCEEERSRCFPVNYPGSRYLCRILDEEILSSCDRDGIVFADALRQSGFLHIPFADYPPLPARFVELHIEQGGVLEHENIQLGVVTSIVGFFQGDLIFRGQQNHAGTTPMSLRRDPMPVAARLICDLMDWAKQWGDELVCTVGHVSADPGINNVIPASVKVSFDIRSDNRAHLAAAKEYLHSLIAALSGEITIECQQGEQTPVLLDAQGVEDLVRLAGELGCSCKKMPSGAGHDAQVMAWHIPTNMIFIPSVGGVSHSTAEYSTPEMLENGCALLREYLRHLAW